MVLNAVSAFVHVVPDDDFSGLVNVTVSVENSQSLESEAVVLRVLPVDDLVSVSAVVVGPVWSVAEDGRTLVGGNVMVTVSDSVDGADAMMGGTVTVSAREGLWCAWRGVTGL